MTRLEIVRTKQIGTMVFLDDISDDRSRCGIEMHVVQLACWHNFVEKVRNTSSMSIPLMSGRP